VEDVVNAWKGRRVSITGHTGFKGGWLALWLAKHGAQVSGYALEPTTDPNLFTTASVATVLEDIRGDILHLKKLESSLAEFRPEVVFHLAAQPILRRSYIDPLGTYATNVMGTANVMEAVRKITGVRAVICITTDKVYEDQYRPRPYRETDRLGGYDPYSSSKACAELVVAAYRSSFFPVDRLDEHGVGAATARAGNVIGGGDWGEDRLIPDLIRGFRAKQPVLIRRPKAVRPWQHVLEPLHGYIKLAERLLAGDSTVSSSFNFGPNDDDAWTVEQIATKLAGMWGDGASWYCDGAPTPHETHTLRVDSTRAREELGWKPHLPIETALDWTMSWYRGWQRGSDMKQETLAQIEEYERLVESA
jgi:CDP-glucose 4,6-dehydratase